MSRRLPSVSPCAWKHDSECSMATDRPDGGRAVPQTIIVTAGPNIPMSQHLARGGVIACLLLVTVLSRTALMGFAASTSVNLRAPLSAALDCVKGALKKNSYGLVPNNAGQASGTESIIGVRRLSADEVKWYGALGVLKNREAHIDYGLARTSVSLIPLDALSARISLTTSILVFTAPGIPLMRPSRFFSLQSNGELEADLLASLNESGCAGLSAPSLLPR